MSGERISTRLGEQSKNSPGTAIQNLAGDVVVLVREGAECCIIRDSRPHLLDELVTNGSVGDGGGGEHSPC